MLRRSLEFFTQRWMLGLIAVVGLSLLIWFGGPLVAIADQKPLAPESARFLAILLLLLIWGFDNLRSHQRQRRAGEQLTQALSQPELGNGQPSKAASELDAEQAVLSRKLREAFKILERARLDKGRKLYQLPWYVVIGASGSGKTTALKNAGLRFPLESQLGDNPVQGSGGTRYCDWWFTDQAVLLDTAGRYTTQDNPKEQSARAWLVFLAELKKGRPKRPLNGILVTVSIHELVSKTPTQQAMQAAAIKRRIQELNGHLDMELPVYLLFTKCDLIAGFAEFFADLDQEERQQAWGVAFPLARAGATGGHLDGLAAQYRRLLTRARDRVLQRLDGEVEPNRRALIFDFPRQMLSLRPAILAFLRDIFVPNQFEQPALLRGVYFVSGTQTDAAGEWVSGVLPAALCSPRVGGAVIAAPKGFFLERVFKHVIFGEAHLARANQKAERRFRWSYAGLLASICLSFSMAGSALYLSHRENHRYMDEVVDNIEAYRAAFNGGLPLGEHDWLLLARGLDELRALPKGAGSGEAVPLQWPFGLDQSEKVGSQARWTYQTALQRFFMPRLAAELTEHVERATGRDDYLYEALRFYLMLFHPEKMDRDAFTEWTDLIWAGLYPDDQHASLRETLATHLAAALEQGVTPHPLDTTLVAAARESLAEVPLERRIYRQIKSDQLQRFPGEFSVESVLGRRAQALFYRPSGKPLNTGVSQLFTYNVFHGSFNAERRQFVSRLADEGWIYGGESELALSDDEIESISEAVAALYLQDYQRAWHSFLEDLAIKGFHDPGDGRVVVQTLARADAPLIELLLAVRQHTALSEMPAVSEQLMKVAEAATQNVMVNQRRRFEGVLADDTAADIVLPGGEVDAAFTLFNEYATSAAGLPLQRLQQSFDGLSQYLDTLAESDNRDRAAFTISRNPEQSSAALQEVRSALAAAPAVVRNWFGPVVANAQQITSRGATAHANEVWRVEVLPFYERAIKGRYPVDPTADREIRLADFRRFFGPGGILDSYSQQYVMPFVVTANGKWTWRKQVGMSAATLQLFQRAKRIEEAWFEGGKPQVAFTLRPKALDTAVTHALLDVAGEQVRYSHGPVRNTRLQWSGEKPGQSRLVLSLASQGTPVSVREDGEWSVFRLLDRHAKTEPLPQREGLMISFALDGITAKYELEPQRVANPFTDRAIQRFDLPSRL